MKAEIVMYTDGACSNNQNKQARVGAYAYKIIARINGSKPISTRVIGSVFPDATNNKAELMGLIGASKKAIELIVGAGITEVHTTCYSDANYVVKAFQDNWLPKWKENGWRTSDRRKVSNIDLWKEADELTSQLGTFEIKKVRGLHEGDIPRDVHERINQEVNNYAQKLAGSRVERRETVGV